MNDGRVISNFIVQALKGKPLTIYGKGTQTRSFQYIDDLIEGTIRMMEIENETGPMNIGNPAEFTILEIAEKIIKLTGSKSKITYTQLPSDDPIQRQPDISLARKKLKWEPFVNLDHGLTDTIVYFEKLLGLERA